MEEIFAVDDRKYEVVSVPEWGGEVKLKSLSGAERDRFEATLQEQRGGKTKQNYDNFRARLIALCAVNDDGTPLFPSKQAVVLLGNKNVAALQRLFNTANELSGLSEKDVEELTEGFDEAPDESSTSV